MGMAMSYTSSSPSSTEQSPVLRLSHASRGHPLNGSSMPPAIMPTIEQVRVSVAARGGLAVVDHAGELIALVKLYPRYVNFASTVSDLNVPLISEVNCGSRGSGSEKSEAE